MVASKDADHQPLYRQSEIYACEGVAPERSMLADWVGRPVVQEALEWVAALYAVEKAIRGRPPDQRRQVRQKRSRPAAEDLFAWTEIALPKLSGRSGSAF